MEQSDILLHPLNKIQRTYLLGNSPLMRVPERSSAREPYVLEAGAHRPEIGVLPQTHPDHIIKHDLPDLVIKFLACFRICGDGLLIEQGIQLLITVTLPVATIRVIRADNL